MEHKKDNQVLFGIDVVATVFGGQLALLSRIIFTVVGIAREYKEISSWMNAIKTDTYPWPNLVAMEEHHSLWAQYGIPNAAGRTLLINADGIVVKINPSAKEVEEYLMAQQNK